MRARYILFFIIHISLVINGFCQENYPFQIGFSQAVITPTDTAYIAGHTHNRVFKGVNDDIYVKALVISNGIESMALLTFDCIGLLYPQLVHIRRIVKEEIPGFPTNQIAMTSTHTHSGPDVVGLWGPDLMHSGVDHDYMNDLVHKASDAIITAWASKRAVRAEYAMTYHGQDWVHNISEPADLDRSVTVLRFLDDHEHNVATLTNFACHPTFLDAVNDKVSSDYVGGYYKAMDEKQGGGNMFLQGSIGGWVQPEYETKTPKQAFFRGGELAANVLRILKEPTPLKGSSVLFKSEIFNMPLENSGFTMLSKAGVLDRDFTDSVTTEVAYFTIGNAAFATHPGETVPQLSHRTKELMHNDGPKFVIGLGMDALGYILKPYFFDPEKKVPHSPYLCNVSVGPQTQEYVYEVLKRLFNSKD